MLESINARSWSTTEATITSSRIEEHDGEDGSTYSAEFTYEYKVDGQAYTNDRYSFLEISGSHRSARRLVAKHPVGSKVSISFDPADPQRSVMEKKMGWGLLFGLIPLLFVVVGGGIIWFGLMGWPAADKSKHRGISSSVRPASGKTKSVSPDLFSAWSKSNQTAEEKDQEFDGPQKLEPAYSPVTILIVAGIFTLFWNFVVSFLVREVIEDGFPIFTTLFAIPFVLVGLGGIGFCVYTFLSIFNPKIEVALSNGAVALGEQVDVAWEVVGNVASIRRLSIIVQGEESATYRRGTDTITDTETFKKIEIVVSENKDEMQFGTATIQIPADTMHSFDGGNNAIKWSIEVHADIPRWPDVKQSMEFRVRPGTSINV